MKVLSFFTAFLLPIYFFGQAANPVKWEAKYTELANGEGEIMVSATIEKGWHTYSQNISPDAGPVQQLLFSLPAATSNSLEKPLKKAPKKNLIKHLK